MRKKYRKVINFTKKEVIFMINFEKIAEEWLIYVKNRIKISTYACYVRLLRTHILPYFKNYEITSIDQIAISQFIEKKRQNGRIDNKGGL